MRPERWRERWRERQQCQMKGKDDDDVKARKKYCKCRKKCLEREKEEKVTAAIYLTSAIY
jgi:hypothetical protein